MSDLVKRLRQAAYECDEQAGPSTWADTMRSAALHIETLERLQRICGTARREALERDGDQWKFVAERLANSKAFDEREVIRREALEEAARVADDEGMEWVAQTIAARIRALKEKE